MKFTFTAAQRVQITGVGDFFRLLSTVAAVTVEFYASGRKIAERVDVEAGYAEQFRTIQFDRVDITSATAQLVQWETALGSEIRYDRGAASITGTVALDSATLLALELINVRPEAHSGSSASVATLSPANTAEQIFAPGSNTNGAILLSADLTWSDASTQVITLIAKSSAPASITDGAVYMQGKNISGTYQHARLEQPQYIAAGLGLYWISNATMTAGSQSARSTRYKLLQ